MTRNIGNGQETRRMRTNQRKRRIPPLSLRQPAPPDWHHDRPAYAGDPFMDWESGPEPPKETRWILSERRASSRH